MLMTHSFKYLTVNAVSDVEFGIRLSVSDCIDRLFETRNVLAFFKELYECLDLHSWKEHEHFVVLEHIVTLLRLDIAESDLSEEMKTSADSVVMLIINHYNPYLKK